MTYYQTSQEWLRQSAMLLDARPTTTKITTSYNLTSKQTRRKQKRAAKEAAAAAAAAAAEQGTTTTTTQPQKQQQQQQQQPPPRASLTIKTYDPVSGVCLKYKTTKAAEVSRLILCLGQLGRKMAALPADEAVADVAMPDAPPAVEGGGGEVEASVEQPAAASSKPAPSPAQGQQGGGGGKGKKKRGKK
ncbi:signal recognition particle 9 kDa protein-domain-containing protein [Xylariaceae sp. FL0255]|nr:signal recognition particle 9 kDa protein-domain-containing protein [Xylariaceae sp. FL0255]